MNSKPDKIDAEQGARKAWVEPAFEVMDAEDAEGNAAPGPVDFGIYS